MLQSLRRLRVLAPAAAAVLLVAGCAAGPRIRSQSAPNADVTRYQTYGFFEKLGTDTSTYASVLSLNLKEATSREMERRGYRRVDQGADLLVNFDVTTKDRIESRGTAGPVGLGLGLGWGDWRYGYGWGLGIRDTMIQTVTDGTLTVDVVDRAKNEIVWSGSAASQVTSRTLDDPKGAIDAAVPKIFERFPKAPATH
jgi:hypothetical protein